MKTTLHLAAIMSIMILGAGCHTAERLLDQGRYDELLSLTQRKMAGKKERSEKYVLLAEEAFAKITKRDMDRIEDLKLSDRSEDWKEIAAIANRIDSRQERLEPFLPLVAENGYQASFSFVRTSEIIHFAENQIVERLYGEGMSFLADGNLGNKSAAQSAYYKFDDVITHDRSYRDALRLRDEARQLGIVHVLIEVENKMRPLMPGYVANALDESVAMNNALWTHYYTSASKEIKFDYIARLVVNNLEIGPEAVREERIPRKKKIEDGWDYVLDVNGNVAKDSLGNDIKRPRYTEVHAIVMKSYQEKGVYLKGRVEIADAKHGQVIESHPVQLESRFYHEARTFFGDERALDQGERIHIGLLPFPADDSMMLEVVELIRPVFAAELEKSRYL